MDTNTMLYDERPIEFIQLGENNYMHVGYDGITKIECYEEVGEMTYVPWFAIYQNENIIERVNGKFVIRIHYYKEQ